jgi:hypothetical protein
MRHAVIKQPSGKTPTKHDHYVECHCPHCNRNRWQDESWNDIGIEYSVTMQCHYCRNYSTIRWTKKDKYPALNWGDAYHISSRATVTTGKNHE